MVSAGRGGVLKRLFVEQPVGMDGTAEPRPDSPDTFSDIPGHSGQLSGQLFGQDRTPFSDMTGQGPDRDRTRPDTDRTVPCARMSSRRPDTPDTPGHARTHPDMPGHARQES